MSGIKYNTIRGKILLSTVVLTFLLPYTASADVIYIAPDKGATADPSQQVGMVTTEDGGSSFPGKPTDGTIDIKPSIDIHIGLGDLFPWATIGTKIWDVISHSKPTANVQTSEVSVLPVAQSDWSKVDGWQGPAAKAFNINAVSMIGTSVVAHTYTIAFNYGGRLGGVGHYIANATIIPSKLDVAWGYSFDSKVEFSDAINTGTAADPMPGLTVKLFWSIESMFKRIQGVETFFIKGDGSIERINPTALKVSELHRI